MSYLNSISHDAPLQVWSITYHSWLTFVLLLWACLIWMLRARRHFATLCSPFILLYGLALCFLQYVWAMDLQPELPRTVGTMSLRQLGLDRAQYPCLRLGAMVRREGVGVEGTGSAVGQRLWEMCLQEIDSAVVCILKTQVL